MRTFVVAGSPEGRRPDGLAPGEGDRVVAVDLGAAHVQAWGWPLHLLIGDLDSLPADQAAAARARGIPVVKAPSAKDETDLELAVAHALEWNPDEIVICSALGGRADHALANILLLGSPELTGRAAMIADGDTTIRVMAATGEAEPAHLALPGQPGDLLSLLPIEGDAQGVVTSGLVYPLHDEALLFGHGRGISNLFMESLVQVWLRSGKLLAIHIQASDHTEQKDRGSSARG